VLKILLPGQKQEVDLAGAQQNIKDRSILKEMALGPNVLFEQPTDRHSWRLF